MANMDFNLTGLDQALERLRELPKRIQRSGLRKAGRAGINIVRDAARANAKRIDDPATASNIAKNIAVQVSAKRSRQVGGLVIRVGVRGGARQYQPENQTNSGKDTWYWRLVEFGRGSVRAKANKVLANRSKGQFFGKSVGPARAQPFLRPALANNVAKVTDEFTRVLNQEIDKAIQQQGGT